MTSGGYLVSKYFAIINNSVLNILEVNLCKQSQLFATDKFSDVELLRICTFLEETVKYCQRSPPEIPFPTFIHFPVNSQTSVLQLCFN